MKEKKIEKKKKKKNEKKNERKENCGLAYLFRPFLWKVQLSIYYFYLFFGLET